jgi:hypothetical protein
MNDIDGDFYEFSIWINLDHLPILRSHFEVV